MEKPRSVKEGPSKTKVETNGEGRTQQTEKCMALASHTVTILEAIRDTKTSLETQIAAVVSGVGLLRDYHKPLSDRVKETEDQLVTTLSHLKELSAKCTVMEREVKLLAQRLEGVGGRSRCYNI
ncbi:hypothetical protein NDU88_001462 [Pleurodeles waltl]|uniref:Uncharacterized protein n=1 Tax=Pleurodeles waltl TaxID=8319 RepID=A0AAV7NF87_PLEWA|nr:hypothetical protein NDU88_001462 [Pleurodeles waltl]